MSKVHPSHATYRDLEAAPPNLIAEIIDGELYLQALAMNLESHVAASMREVLYPPFYRGRGGPGGWWIRMKSQFSFGDRDWRTVVPDLSAWKKSRVPTLPEEYFEVAPDWVCEVLSPSTRLVDRTIKARVYAEEGIPHFWIIDPAFRTLECLENVEGTWVERARFEGAAQVAAPPFDAVSFDLSDLWPPE